MGLNTSKLKTDKFYSTYKAFLSVIQASAAKQTRTVLFWVVTQRVAVIFYRRFGTTYRVPSSGFKNPLKMGLIGYAETSVIIYCHSLRNNAEEHSSQVLIFLWPWSPYIYRTESTRARTPRDNGSTQDVERINTLYMTAGRKEVKREMTGSVDKIT